MDLILKAETLNVSPIQRRTAPSFFFPKGADIYWLSSLLPFVSHEKSPPVYKAIRFKQRHPSPDGRNLRFLVLNELSEGQLTRVAVGISIIALR